MFQRPKSLTAYEWMRIFTSQLYPFIFHFARWSSINDEACGNRLTVGLGFALGLGP